MESGSETVAPSPALIAVDFHKCSSALSTALHTLQSNTLTSAQKDEFEQLARTLCGLQDPTAKISPELEAIVDLSFRTCLEKHILDGVLMSAPSPLESPVARLLDVALHLAEKGIMEPSLATQLLQDLVDGHSAGHLPRVFLLFEHVADRLATLCATSRLARITSMRVGNELLRRIGKRPDENSFNSRVVLFLSYIMPLGEIAGLTIPAPSSSHITCETAPELTDEQPVAADTAFYRSFWSLQSAFYNPSSLSKTEGWTNFVRAAEAVLNMFSSVSPIPAPPAPLTSPPELASDAHAFFVRFLSHGRLFKLQLRDPQFRRYILIELLSMLQTLTFTPARTALPPIPKQPKVAVPFILPPLKDKQKVVSDLQRQARDLLERTTPGGHGFADALSKALVREANWVLWKRDSGPALEKAASTASTTPVSPAPAARVSKRKRPEPAAPAASTPSLGPIPLEGLALASESEKGRSLEEFVLKPLREEADPESGIEPTYRRCRNKLWIWKAYRMIARNDLRLFAKLQAAEMKGQEVTLEELVRQTPAAAASVTDEQAVDTKVSEEDHKASQDEAAEPVDFPPLAPSADSANDFVQLSSPAEEHKPPTEEHKPTTEEHKPATEEHKPSTEEHKPPPRVEFTPTAPETTPMDTKS